MKLPLGALKKAASLYGIDFNNLSAIATPAINEKLDEVFAQLPVVDKHTSGIIITKGGDGYHCVLADFDEEAHYHVSLKADSKLNDLIKSLLSKLEL